MTVGTQPASARASRLRGPRDLVFEDEVIDRTLGAGELLVATECSAISPGTELAAYAGLPPLRPGPVYPRLVGYCNCGRVIAVGEDVDGIAVGDRVLTHAPHRSHYKTTMAGILASVPTGLGSAEASTAYLFHLGYVALLRVGVQAGQHVAVIGLGVLGMSTVAVARMLGARVTALSHRAAALDVAGRFGADEATRLDTEPRGVDADVVVTTANSWGDWLAALQAAGASGTIAVLGFPGRGEPPPPFNPLASQYFYDKQLRLIAVGHATDAELSVNMSFLVNAIARGELPAAEMARHRRPALELADAYEELLQRPDAVLTTVLEW